MAPLFDLRATHNPHRWFLPVVPELCVGIPSQSFLFGGVGLAAAISAMERTCGRPVIWATAQYLSFARPGSIVDLDVWVPAAGNQTSQARVLLHVDDQQIVTVHAALGQRDSPFSDQWVGMPTVPGPDDCPAVRNWRAADAGLQSRFETRLAGGRYPDGRRIVGRGVDGRLLVWIRSREGHLSDASTLAIAADFVSVAIGNAIGRSAGGNSLDNTIRYAHRRLVEWMLCDIRIESVHAGIVHGTMHLFAPDGALLAAASQSLILRLHPEPETSEEQRVP